MEKIFWVDLEMTGLDPERSVILEFAAIVTDLKLEPMAQYHAVVRQPQSELDKMNDWNRQTHSQSGLLDRVPDGKPLAEVERETIAFVRRWFGDEQPVMAGNSIHQDRKFIDRQMKSLAKILHYRMLDVSSFKQVFREMYGVHYQKNGTHRAFDDITASIEELKHYLTFIYAPNNAPAGA